MRARRPSSDGGRRGAGARWSTLAALVAHAPLLFLLSSLPAAAPGVASAGARAQLGAPDAGAGGELDGRLNRPNAGHGVPKSMWSCVPVCPHARMGAGACTNWWCGVSWLPEHDHGVWGARPRGDDGTGHRPRSAAEFA
eukprot:4862645-Prymnesium_polylepis.1